VPPKEGVEFTETPQRWTWVVGGPWDGRRCMAEGIIKYKHGYAIVGDIALWMGVS
jgi:hypothetical protein